MEFVFLLIVIVGCFAAMIMGFVKFVGSAKFVIKSQDHTPFVVEEITDKSITVMTQVEFENRGKQCGTIMDCYIRHLLPYEQFDGIKVFSKAEVLGAPREDDYFEAVLIEKGKKLDIVVKVTLVARREISIKEALTEMVDLPLDIVYQHVSRDPWQIGKERIVLTAEEIARLAGVTLQCK